MVLLPYTFLAFISNCCVSLNFFSFWFRKWRSGTYKRGTHVNFLSIQYHTCECSLQTVRYRYFEKLAQMFPEILKTRCKYPKARYKYPIISHDVILTFIRFVYVFSRHTVTQN